MLVCTTRSCSFDVYILIDIPVVKIINMEKRVECVVKKMVEDKNLINVVIDTNNGLKTDGYLGDMVFAKVTATKRNGENIIYHLALKLGKVNEHIRQTIPVTTAYQQEMYMYDTVFPFYKKFQREKGLGSLEYIPTCYGTFKNEEVLVLENLKQLGYQMHPRDKPLNVKHIQTVLRVYGKWHALSFAINDQRKEEYKKIITPLKNVLLDIYKSAKYVKSCFCFCLKKTRNILQEHENVELLRKFNKITQRGDLASFYEALDVRESKNVIVHGDCWNNNFMFKYKGNENNVPEQAALLDWQVAFPASPVFDLSYHIYAVSSKTELDHFDDLLQAYYQSLADHIKKLGSNPDTLFTYSELMEHWKKYSLFGMLMGLSILPFMICNLEDAPTFEDPNFDDKLDFELPSEEYYNRVTAILEHYFSFQDI